MVGGEKENWRGRRILIVDDDPSGARLLGTLLTLAGYEPFQPEDWRNPLSDIEKHRPDLVIVDVHLRNRSGFDLLNRIRTHPDPRLAGTTVIMMSAEDYRVESKRAGADGFLAKPFDVPAMLRTIAAMEGG